MSTLSYVTQIVDTTKQLSKVSRVEEEVNISLLHKDLKKCCSIWQYYVDQRDKIHITYIRVGPYQPTN